MKRKSIRNLFIIVLLGIVLSCFLHKTSLALAFKNNDGYLFFMNNDTLKISKDEGESWFSRKIPTSETCLGEDRSGNIYLVGRNHQDLYLTKFNPRGFSFENQKIIYHFDSSPESFSAALANDTIYLFYLSKKNLYFAYSFDYGDSFSPAQTLNNYLPVEKFTSSQNGESLAFLSENRIYYAPYDKGWPLPREIYQTQNEIGDLKIINEKIFWTENTKDGKHLLNKWENNGSGKIFEDTFPIVNLNLETSEVVTFSLYRGGYYLPHYVVKNGSYSNPKLIKDQVYGGENFEAILLLKSSLSGLWSAKGQPFLNKLQNTSPIISSLTLKDKTINGKLEVSLAAYDYDSDPLSFLIEVSWDQNFDRSKRWTFTIATPEAQIPLPLPDGKYYVRAFASDLFSISPQSNTAIFYIDREPPKFTILSPEKGAASNTSTAGIKGLLSEAANVSINSIAANVSDLVFFGNLELKPGENQIQICATDEAGNSTSESFVVIYNPEAPQITLLKPSASFWLKSGATIFLEALVDDLEDDLNDETEAEVKIDDQTLDQSVAYMKDEKRISGFINLPQSLSHGEHVLRLLVKDLKGNIGFCSAKLKIDLSAPKVAYKNASIYRDRIVIPIDEGDSGLDLSGTFFSIKCSSAEITGKIKLEDNNIVFIPGKMLEQGAYDVKIKPRDLVGNIGQENIFTLNLNPLSACFSQQDNSSSVKISYLANGPNPFCLSKDKTTLIKYQLSKTADLKFYLFNLEGAQILSREFKQTLAGSIPWDGKNCLGEIVSQGVYFYVLMASDNIGKSEIKQGKIILLQ